MATQLKADGFWLFKIWEIANNIFNPAANSVRVEGVAGGVAADVNVATIVGVPPQLDDTDKQAVSVYGEDAAAGDTPLHIDGTYGARICHPNDTSGTVDADPDINNAPLTDVGNVLRYWTRNYLFNGVTWDRQRNNEELIMFASAARTATANSPDTTNFNNNSGLLLFVNVSALAATPSVVPQLEYKDSISGVYEPIWIATTAITATGEYVYMFGLGGVGSAGEYDEAVNLLIPRTFRLTMTHGDVDSITYSVSSVLLS